MEWLQARKEDDSFFDVSANLPEEESRIVKVQQMSIQLAVGLAAAVVAAGTVESASVLSEIPASLTRFVAVASADKELSEIVKDAQEVLQLLNMLGLKTDVQVQAAQVASRASVLGSDMKSCYFVEDHQSTSSSSSDSTSTTRWFQ